jgi:uncharacterized protein
VSAALLDVNLLIALFWPAHAQHGAALRWFGKIARRGWATCPHTENAFIRITSNPSFSRDAVSPHEAARLLSENTALGGHVFWKEQRPPCKMLASHELAVQGHQQVSDAYLLALALEHQGRLATFDRGIATVFGKDQKPAAHLEIVPV